MTTKRAKKRTPIEALTVLTLYFRKVIHIHGSIEKIKILWKYKTLSTTYFSNLIWPKKITP